MVERYVSQNIRSKCFSIFFIESDFHIFWDGRRFWDVRRFWKVQIMFLEDLICMPVLKEEHAIGGGKNISERCSLLTDFQSSKLFSQKIK